MQISVAQNSFNNLHSIEILNVNKLLTTSDDLI